MKFNTECINMKIYKSYKIGLNLMRLLCWKTPFLLHDLNHGTFLISCMIIDVSINEQCSLVTLQF